MSKLNTNPSAATKPEFKNINAFKDLTTYRLPPAGWVSILHRVSGLLMFVLLPLIIWLFDKSVTSEISYEELKSMVGDSGLAWVPAWLLKLVLLALLWAFLHHLLAGLRHLYMDGFHKVDKAFGKNSAWVVLVLSGLLTLVFGAKLFGLY